MRAQDAGDTAARSQEDIPMVSARLRLVSQCWHQSVWSGVRTDQSSVSHHIVSQSSVSANHSKVGNHHNHVIVLYV